VARARASAERFGCLSVGQRLGRLGDGVLLGIEDLTALVKASGGDHWRVEGQGAVHILSGLPKRLLRSGEEIQL